MSLSHHPCNNTHYNRLFGTSQQILNRGIVPGQELGEGLEETSAHLNSLPLSPLLVVGSRNTEMFTRYFVRKTAELKDDTSDYLVFTRNRGNPWDARKRLTRCVG